MQNDVPESAPPGRFAGREAFRESIRQAIFAAAEQRWREMVFSDVDFQDWPLNERPVVEALGAWVRGNSRLLMLGKRYDLVVRTQPLFTEWRRFWSHKIECRQVTQADPQDLPSALWSANWIVQRMDLVRSGGISGPEPERRVVLRESIDEWVRRSASGFPATTLGL